MTNNDGETNEGQDEPDEGRRTSHQLRDILARNGSRFLTRAAAELGANPAEASIHLCSGIELLMKTRLAHEHWTLVDSQPGARTLQTLHTGDFVSVGFSDAIQRFGAVAGATFKNGEREVLEKASKHSNRVVHFFHRDPDNEGCRQEAAIELSRAWGIFERRIRGKWKDAFPNAPLDELHIRMKTLQPYLQARYNDAQYKLQELNAGGRVERCGICGFESRVLSSGDFQILDLRCEVCGAADELLRFTCTGCSTRIELKPEVGGAECPNEDCNDSFNLDEICAQIGVEGEPPAYCDGCYIHEKTVYSKSDHSEGICLSCLRVYEGAPLEAASQSRTN